MDDFDDFTDKDLDSYETMVSRQPRSDDYNTFVQRNDPKPIIDRLKLRLMNAYEEEIEVIDEKTGKAHKKIKLHFIPKTKPLANKQGIQQILSYVENYVNNHCVQAHIIDKVDYNAKMNAYADDITLHFIANREKWGIFIGDCDILISTTIGQLELFLSRALYNKEREGYTDGYKEVVDRKIQPMQKPSMVQRAGSFLTGSGGSK